MTAGINNNRKEQTNKISLGVSLKDELNKVQSRAKLDKKNTTLFSGELALGDDTG